MRAQRIAVSDPTIPSITSVLSPLHPPSSSSSSPQDFIAHEFVHFSHADNLRSIPSAIDGLKPSQRKVLVGQAGRQAGRQAGSGAGCGVVCRHGDTALLLLLLLSL